MLESAIHSNEISPSDFHFASFGKDRAFRGIERDKANKHPYVFARRNVLFGFPVYGIPLLYHVPVFSVITRPATSADLALIRGPQGKNQKLYLIGEVDGLGDDSAVHFDFHAS
jgi:hypothetical protein